MKFAAWRKVLSIFLLAVFLCAVPSLLTACSRSPASGSTELLDSTQLYFIELGRLVPGFEQPMLDSFREAAEKPPLPLRFSATTAIIPKELCGVSGCKGGICAYGAAPGCSGAESGSFRGRRLRSASASAGLVFLRDRSVALCVSGCLRCKIQHESSG